MKHIVTVTRSRRGLGFPEAYRLVRRAVRAALEAEKVSEPCTVDVTFTDDEHIREINRQFRNVDAATDVLSFPLCELTPGRFDPEACGWDPDSGTIPLGDVVLSLERCEKQGEEFGHGFGHELMYLTVHSVLHLLGYDHVDEGARKKQMRAREKQIMAILEGKES